MNFHSYLGHISNYEAGKPLELLMRDYGLDSKDIIKLGSNENPLGSSNKVLECIKNNAHLASIYVDDSYYELKDLLAKHYDIQQNNIIIGSGSDQIIEFCIHTTCDTNSSVLMAKYTFAMYDIYAKTCGAKSIRIDDFYHNLDSMLESYKKHKPKIIFICTPNNPLGEALKKKDVLDFIKKIDDDTLIVLDCAYMEYAALKDKEYEILPRDIVEFNNVIYLGTFSKVYGLGGMRVGYGIANEDIIKNLNKVRPPFNITNISLKTAIEAIKDRDFIQKSLENNLQEMKKYEDFIKKLDSNDVKYIHSYANFITIMFENFDSTKLSNDLLRHGIIIRDLKSYALNAIRITIGTQKQNDVVLSALAKMIH